MSARRLIVGSILSLCMTTVGLAGLPAIAAAESCPNAAFRTGPSLHLPECRAYEMVTPPFKGGAAVIKAEGVSPDGEAVGLNSFAGFAGTEVDEGLEGVFYVSQRSETGWKTVSLTPSMSQFDAYFGETGLEKVGFGFYRRGWSSDQDSMLWTLRGVSQPPGSVDYYLTRADGSVVDVGPAMPSKPEPAGVSGDLSHVVVDGPEGLEEYLVGSGSRTPVALGVQNDGKPIDECPSQELALSVQVFGGSVQPPEHVVSEDGSVAFVSDPCKEALYARVDNGQPGAYTVAISEPSKEDCAACETAEGVRKPARFVDASEDGSRVFFSTAQPLLGGEGGVYQYDAGAPAGQRVVTAIGSSAGLRGVVSISSDGSHIYFVSGGVLTPTPNYAGQSAEAGANNLYLFERDSQYPAGRTVFIAALPANDESTWREVESFKDASALVGAEGAHGGIHGQTTPDGDFLVFLSHARLTPDDTSTAGQVFEYDAQANTMVRVSIGQGGFNDNGNSSTYNVLPTNTGFYGIWEDQWFEDPYDPRLAPGRNLTVSADGSYVVFESSDGLTPQALNHVLIATKNSTDSGGTTRSVAFAHNVYEYHDGNVYLISDGRDVAAVSSFTGLGVSAVGGLEGTDSSGRDVFFRTADELLPQDTDTSVDVYDARIDGGFPQPPPGPECTADACQGSLSGAPVLLSPGSELQAGGENVAGSSEAGAAPSSKVVKKKTQAKRKGKKRKRKAKKAAVSGRGRGGVGR